MRQDKASIIVGQGEVNAQVLTHFVSDYPLIALDGAARYLADRGVVPDHIIGDMDSLSATQQSQSAEKIIKITEQDSNDFEKALYHLAPPVALGFGLFGKRFDQAMANCHVMAKYHAQSRIIAITNDEIITVHKGTTRLDAQQGEPVAIIPLAPLRFASSEGLHYQLDGLSLGFGVMVSSSNYATAATITLTPMRQDEACAYAVCRPLSLLKTGLLF